MEPESNEWINVKDEYPVPGKDVDIKVKNNRGYEVIGTALFMGQWGWLSETKGDVIAWKCKPINRQIYK